jgi:hypothetical protein
VGKNGQTSDATIWRQSTLRASLMTGTLNLPEPDNLPGSDMVLPYHIIGDDIFPLTTHMMKPYPRQVNLDNMERRVFDFRYVTVLPYLEISFLRFFFLFIWISLKRFDSLFLLN